MGKRLFAHMLLLVLLGMVCWSLNIQAEPEVAAVYIFGDSTFEVGTNHFLLECTAQAGKKFYGIDFPNSQPTGRFSNGYNTADRIAMLAGLEKSPPPFLLLVQNDTAYFRTQILKGVNFASGRSGILNQTGTRFKRVISLGEQIQQFVTVHSNISEHLNSTKDAEAKINESLFFLSVGSNDFLDLYYLNNNTVNETLKQDFLNNVMATYKYHLESLKNLGARKFGILSAPPLGCVPIMRLTNGGHDCNEDLNTVSEEFYVLLKGVLQNLSSQFPEMKYSLVNSYNMSMPMIKHPEQFGLDNSTSPCCVNSNFECGPDSDVCQNRKKFLFWIRSIPHNISLS